MTVYMGGSHPLQHYCHLIRTIRCPDFGIDPDIAARVETGLQSPKQQTCRPGTIVADLDSEGPAFIMQGATPWQRAPLTGTKLPLFVACKQ